MSTVPEIEKAVSNSPENNFWRFVIGLQILMPSRGIDNLSRTSPPGILTILLRRLCAIFARAVAGICEAPRQSRFWEYYAKLPANIQKLADANYELLKADPRYPSLHFKKVGRFWSVRIGVHYRAAAVEDGADIVWFWIGHHSEYDRIIAGRR